MTLVEDDTRHDNLDAVDLYHDVLARVLARIRGAEPAGPVADLKGYAAVIAHNAWSDYIRDKYPKRASLKNRLRYFLSHQPRYGVWETAAGDVVGGFRIWQLSGVAAVSSGLAALRSGTDILPQGSLPRRAIENCDGEDWDRLLVAIFDHLGGPVDLDDLAGIVAELVGLKEDRTDSLTADEDGDGAEDAAASIADPGSTPEDEAEMNSALRRLWLAIKALKSDYRCAYLLNIPGPGKSRGDIEVFALRRIASIVEIGETLALSDRQYELAWELVGLAPEDRGQAVRLTSPDEKFCMLWKYLPLDDTTISRLLGLERQQVINRRIMALRELARACAPTG